MSSRQVDCLVPMFIPVLNKRYSCDSEGSSILHLGIGFSAIQNVNCLQIRQKVNGNSSSWYYENTVWLFQLEIKHE